jgi:hypothetical protein
MSSRRGNELAPNKSAHAIPRGCRLSPCMASTFCKIGMSDISKLIDETVRKGIAPLLKENRFKKKDGTFYKEYDDRTEVINVQASKWNEGEKGKVTINLGVYYPDIARISEAITFKGLPKEYDCTVRKRIGHLFPSRCDIWWDIESASIDKVAFEQREALTEYGLPWLDKMKNLDEVKLELSESKMAFIASAISIHQRNLKEALFFVEIALKQQPRAAQRIEAWARKHKLTEAEPIGRGNE